MRPRERHVPPIIRVVATPETYESAARSRFQRRRRHLPPKCGVGGGGAGKAKDDFSPLHSRSLTFVGLVPLRVKEREGGKGRGPRSPSLHNHSAVYFHWDEMIGYGVSCSILELSRAFPQMLFSQPVSSGPVTTSSCDAALALLSCGHSRPLIKCSPRHKKSPQITRCGERGGRNSRSSSEIIILFIGVSP